MEKERGRIKAKLPRLKYLYLYEGDLTKSEYRRRKADLQARLDALQVPEQNAIIQAGEYLDTLGELGERAWSSSGTGCCKAWFARCALT